MLISEAQELLVVDSDKGEHHGMSLIPLEVIDAPPDHDLEVSEHAQHLTHPEDQEIIIELSDLPGAPKNVPEIPDEKDLVVEDEKSDKDSNDLASKQNDKWDWAKHGPEGFTTWIKERFNAVPSHSGSDAAGCHRAIAYLEHLDDQISKAMRNDLDGKLNANQIEKIRSQIDHGLTGLYNRVEKINKSTKARRKKKSDLQSGELIVKEAQKITGVQGIYIMAPLLISRIARVCINGMVSAGHDIEDIFDKQVKFYKLSTREQAEVMQLLEDMGYTLKRDRGFLIDYDYDFASSDNIDYSANYNPSAAVWGKDR